MEAYSIFEVRSPDYETPAYWFSKNKNQKNSWFRANLRRKYLNFEKQNRLDELDLPYLYGSRVNVSTKFFTILPGNLTVDEVKQVCRKLTYSKSSLAINP